MSEIINVPMSGQRSLATVTAEIRAYQDAARRMAVEYSIEIGRRLVEAKDMVSHGEWGTYLREELGFSQSTANNHMNMFRAYAADQMRLDGAAVKNQAFANLSYTQALALLALPDEESREAFVETHHMEELSTRELQAEIARLREEKNAAEARANEMAGRLPALQVEKEAAEAAAEDAGRQCVSLRDAVDALKNERKKDAEHVADFQRQAQAANEAKYEAEKRCADLQKKLEAAKKNPTVPKDVLDRLKKEAEAAAQKAADEAMKAAEAAAREEAVREQAEKLAALRAEKEAAEKALLLAAPEMAVFKAAFERVQKDLMALVQSVDSLPEDKRGGAWRGLHTLLDMARSECEGEKR